MRLLGSLTSALQLSLHPIATTGAAIEYILQLVFLNDDDLCKGQPAYNSGSILDLLDTTKDFEHGRIPSCRYSTRLDCVVELAAIFQ